VLLLPVAMLAQLDLVYLHSDLPETRSSPHLKLDFVTRIWRGPAFWTPSGGVERLVRSPARTAVKLDPLAVFAGDDPAGADLRTGVTLALGMGGLLRPRRSSSATLRSSSGVALPERGGFLRKGGDALRVVHRGHHTGQFDLSVARCGASI
jgi:hypothetical protein